MLLSHHHQLQQRPHNRQQCRSGGANHRRFCANLSVATGALQPASAGLHPWRRDFNQVSRRK